MAAASLRILAAAALALSLVACGATKSATPVSSSACGPILTGSTKPRFLIVSDLPLRAPPGAALQVKGIRYELAQAHFRAGKYAVGYQSCDNSTAATGAFDPARCAANLKNIAADTSVLAVIGPYNSPCAQVEIPIANRAPKGPLAMIGTATTDPELTARVPGGDIGTPTKFYPGGIRNFVRIVAPDQYQAAAAAMLARSRHLKRIAVLDDGEPYGQAVASWFRHDAAQLKVHVVASATWSQHASHYTELVAAIVRAHPDGIYFSGYPFLHGGIVLKELRAKLGNGFVAFGPDAWADPGEDEHFAGAAANGFLTTYAGLPDRDVGAAGRAVLRTVGREPPEQYGAPYGAAAAGVALAAIAGSDGSRSSVTRALPTTHTQAGMLGRFGFDRQGDPTIGAIGVIRIEHGSLSFGPTLYPTASFAKSSGVVSAP
jgi:branched-chain amino acid transport system substrate-binding protein